MTELLKAKDPSSVIGAREISRLLRVGFFEVKSAMKILRSMFPDYFNYLPFTQQDLPLVSMALAYFFGERSELVLSNTPEEFKSRILEIDNTYVPISQAVTDLQITPYSLKVIFSLSGGYNNRLPRIKIADDKKPLQFKLVEKLPPDLVFFLQQEIPLLTTGKPGQVSKKKIKEQKKILRKQISSIILTGLSPFDDWVRENKRMPNLYDKVEVLELLNRAEQLSKQFESDNYQWSLLTLAQEVVFCKMLLMYRFLRDRKIKILNANETELSEINQQIEILGSRIREIMILSNLGLVSFVAEPYFRNGNNEDLIQIGIIGLIQAVDRIIFSNLRFSTWAVPIIRKEILAYLNNQCAGSPIPTNTKRLIIKILRVADQLRTSGIEPTIEVIASKIGITPRRVRSLLNVYKRLPQDSTDRFDQNERGFFDRNSEGFHSLEEFMLSRRLDIPPGLLNEYELAVISYMFEQSLPPKEIADLMGLSIPKILVLKNSALRKLKQYFNSMPAIPT
ncbi:MAG: sigma-70 family RNA polymerase sigma factor [Microgenomates group bacterium]|nr:sigma-70 family RNA polymerase sigma factor [Microgenomates group bacterium]